MRFLPPENKERGYSAKGWDLIIQTLTIGSIVSVIIAVIIYRPLAALITAAIIAGGVLIILISYWISSWIGYIFREDK